MSRAARSRVARARPTARRRHHYAVAADAVTGYTSTVSSLAAAARSRWRRARTGPARSRPRTSRPATVITQVVNDRAAPGRPGTSPRTSARAGATCRRARSREAPRARLHAVGGSDLHGLRRRVSGYSLVVPATARRTGHHDGPRPEPTCTIIATDNRADALACSLRSSTTTAERSRPATSSAHVRAVGARRQREPAGRHLTGTLYTLLGGGGLHRVRRAVTDYTFTVSGDCAGNGTITLQLDQDQVCTITANDGAATLTIVTQVINDDGGSAAPGDFLVSVRLDGVEVASRLGSAAGSAFSLPANETYTVTVGSPAGYTSTVAGDCAADGSVTLGVGASRTCSVTANDPPQPPAAQPSVNSQRSRRPSAARPSTHCRRAARSRSSSRAAAPTSTSPRRSSCRSAPWSTPARGT